MKRLLSNTGSSFRLGLLIAILLAGGLWFYRSSAQKQYSEWKAQEESAFWSAMNNQSFGDPIVGPTQDEFYANNPKPSVPTREKIVTWWFAVVGGYAVLVLIVQLTARTKQ